MSSTSELKYTCEFVRHQSHATIPKRFQTLIRHPFREKQIQYATRPLPRPPTHTLKLLAAIVEATSFAYWISLISTKPGLLDTALAALTNESEPGTDEEQASMLSTQERNGES